MIKNPVDARAASPTRWQEAFLAILCLVILLLFFFWPAVFTGRVLLPTDLLFQLDPLWQSVAPEGFTFPGNQLLIDQVYQFYPWKHHAMRMIKTGRLPQWNPFINGGQPFLANSQSALFSPFNVLSYLVPLPASFLVTMLLRLFVAGFFAFLLAREIGMRTTGATLAMLAFTFSGPILVWCGYAIGNVSVWLPAVLFLTERMLRRQSWRYAIAAAAVMGLQFLGGQPEMSFHLMLLWLCYGLYRITCLHGLQWSRWLEPGLKLVTVAIMGFALAAITLLPFLEFVTRSEVLAARATAQTSWLRTLFFEWQAWPSIVLTVLPQFMGTPVDGSYWYPYGNYNEYALYVGVMPLALAAVSVITTRSRRRQGIRTDSDRPGLFFSLVAITALGVSLGWPIFNLINQLPLFRLVLNGRFLRSIYALAIAILAGMGLDRVEASLAQCRDRGNAAVFRLLALITTGIGIACLLIALASLAGMVALEDRIIALGYNQVEANQGHILFPHSLDHYYRQVEAMYLKMRALFEPRNVTMYLPVLMALCILGLYRWSRHCAAKRSRLVIGTVLLVTALDLYAVHGDYNPTTEPDLVFPPVGAVEFLQEAQETSVFRVAGAGLALMPNSSMVFELSDVRGYDAVAPSRYMAVMGLVEGHIRLNHYSLLQKADDPLLDLLNVGYLLSTAPPSGTKWDLVYEDESSTSAVRIYHNRDILPRAFVVYQADYVDDAGESLARLADPTFDYRETVVLEADPITTINLPQSPPPAAGVARITHYEPEGVEIDTDPAADGILVLTDGYDPGWRAEVDGRPAEIYVANHAFRAVAMPAGEHRVTFTYDPPAFEIGLAISLLTCACLAGASVWLLVANRRPARHR